MRLANKPFAHKIGISPSRSRKLFQSIGLDFGSKQQEQAIETKRGLLHAYKGSGHFYDIPGANEQILKDAMGIYPVMDIDHEQALTAHSLRSKSIFQGHQNRELNTLIVNLKSKVPELMKPEEWEQDFCTFEIPGSKDQLTVYRRRADHNHKIIALKKNDEDKVRRALGILENIDEANEISIHTEAFAKLCNQSMKNMIDQIKHQLDEADQSSTELIQLGQNGSEFTVHKKWNKTRPAFVIAKNDLNKARDFFGAMAEYDPKKEIRLINPLYRSLTDRQSPAYQFLTREELSSLIKKHIESKVPSDGKKEFWLNANKSFTVYHTKNKGRVALTIAKHDLRRLLKYIRNCEIVSFKDRILHDLDYRKEFDSLRINDTETLDGIEFENLIQKLFLDSGYQVEVTPTSGDYGADLIIEKDGHKTAIQCKRRNRKSGIRAVQEIYTAKDFFGVDSAMVITNNLCSEPAKKVANKLGVILIDREHLSEWMCNSQNFDQLFL
ncbi:MAG: restriction endonuclease [Cyanobacteria bacterium]|nr:restriction endonuclease [Cyanobacteriota bacterium]